MPWQAAALIGGSALSGILGNRSKKSTQTSSSTRKRILTPVQQNIEGQLGSLLSRRLTDPGAGLEPIRTAARETVNQGYSGAVDTILSKLLSSGQRSSGKAGRAVMETELSRLRDLGGVDSMIAKMMLDREDRTASLAEQLLGINFGEESTGTGSATTPENMLGGGVGAGMETASLLYAMDKF